MRVCPQVGSSIPISKNLLHFDFNINPGLPLGIIGANGIGKTSLFQYLKIHQKDLFKKKRVSFLDQFPMKTLGDMSLEDLLNFYQDEYSERLLPTTEIKDLLGKFKIENRLSTPINVLSGGENQISKIISLFLLQTDIYFLDEPTSFLDTQKLGIFTSFLKDLVSTKMPYVVIIDHKKTWLWEICCEFLLFEEKNEIYATKCIKKKNISFDGLIQILDREVHHD